MARKTDDKNLINPEPSDESAQAPGTFRIQSKPHRRVFCATYKLKIFEKLQEAKSRWGGRYVATSWSCGRATKAGRSVLLRLPNGSKKLKNH